MAVVPLLKALSEAGLGSRRRLVEAIKWGRVTVNGQVAENFRHQIDITSDRVTLDGKPVDLKPAKLIYLMLHKPEGVVCTTSDEEGRRTVIDLLPAKYRQYKLYPVGRLDRDSTGLVILTNDGDLTYRLTHPKFEHEKEYLIMVKEKLSPEDKQKLENGIELEDGLTYPAKVKEVKSTPPYQYTLTIHEGRKRQVRRMLEMLGHAVISLKRVRMGRLTLGDLKEGAVRELTRQEINALRLPSSTGSYSTEIM